MVKRLLLSDVYKRQFRASEAVCRYNNLVFGKLFQAGDANRQAQFAEMDVNISGGADAGVFFYGCRPEGNALEDGECSEADARMLSAFIEKMVHSSNAAGKQMCIRDRVGSVRMAVWEDREQDLLT